jgi:hypothetical protein
LREYSDSKVRFDLVDDDVWVLIGGLISHFPFAAGMLFAAAFGPGRLFAMCRSFLQRWGEVDGVERIDIWSNCRAPWWRILSTDHRG